MAVEYKGVGEATTDCEQQLVYQDSFHINSDLVNSDALKQTVHRLASLDIYNKYRINSPSIQSLHVSFGVDNTVHYTFLAGAVYKEVNQQYLDETPKVSLPTGVFTQEIMESTSGKDKYLDLRKMSLTFRDPATKKVYFQTHTGKVYHNHYAIGEVPLKAPEEGNFVNIDCEHEFKTIEQQTRSGDEEITVTKICVKCNADHRNLRKTPKIIPESVIKAAADAIYNFVDQEVDYAEAHTIARIMSTFDD